AGAEGDIGQVDIVQQGRGVLDAIGACGQTCDGEAAPRRSIDHHHALAIRIDEGHWVELAVDAGRTNAYCSLANELEILAKQLGQIADFDNRIVRTTNVNRIIGAPTVGARICQRVLLPSRNITELQIL